MASDPEKIVAIDTNEYASKEHNASETTELHDDDDAPVTFKVKIAVAVSSSLENVV